MTAENDKGEIDVYYARDNQPGSVAEAHFTDDTRVEQVRNMLGKLGAQVDPRFFAYCDDLPHDIPRDLQAAYRASFKFSAGSPLLQALLQARTAQIINSRTGDPNLLADTAASLPLDEAAFVIPRRHTQQLRPHRLPGRTQALWSFFMDVCQHPDDLDLVQPRDSITARSLEVFQVFATRNFIPFSMTYYMTGQEIAYMEKGRPNRPDDASKYRSLIRECGLLRKPAGSPEFDVIMHEVGQVMSSLMRTDEAALPDFWLFRECKAQSHELVQAWEARHGTESF